MSLLLLQQSQANGFASILQSPTLKNINVGVSSTLTINRGGAHSPSYATKMDSDDYDTSDDDDDSEPIEVDLVTSSFADVAAMNAKQMSNSGSAMDEGSRSQQSNSYFLSAALWASLACDTILNKKKRCMIFPGVAEVGGFIRKSNIAATAGLASGFLLSVGLAFFLATDLNRDSSTTPVEDELKNETMRRKLHLLLFSYGIVNLGANINPLGTTPFFGIGGFVINAHNALIALNGWIKESSSSAVAGADPNATIMDFFKTSKSMIGSLFRNADVSLGFTTRMMSSLYMACAFIAVLRSVDIVSNALVPHYMTCFAAKSVRINEIRT